MKTESIVAKVLNAVNTRDMATFVDMHTSDIAIHDPFYPTPLQGREMVQADMETFVKAFSDMQLRMVRMVDGDDTFAVELELTGTHTGPLDFPDGAIPPTQRRVTLPMASFGKVSADGRIAESTRYYDVTTMLQQLGIETNGNATS